MNFPDLHQSSDTLTKNTSKQNNEENFRRWCTLLKTTPSEFFSMPEDELQIRINNLKGRTQLKIAKKLITYQIKELKKIEKLQRAELRRLIGGAIDNSSKQNTIIQTLEPPANIDENNVWDILYQAAEQVDELYRRDEQLDQQQSNENLPKVDDEDLFILNGSEAESLEKYMLRSSMNSTNLHGFEGNQNSTNGLDDTESSSRRRKKQ